MNNIAGSNIIRFIILLLVQVVICNHINFFGYVNPYIYIIFIFLFPIREERLILLIVSFMLGLLVDVFSDSGGVHAAAAVSLAYIRPVLLKSSYGMLYEHQSIKFNSTDIGSLITYISLGTVIHHFIMFSLETFNITHILLVLKKTLFSSIFTIILSVLIIILFSRKRK
ncbi:rod shape-determining protein MreD [Winogradskyella epiphytica]|uniref:Rod shape-determining protein MreD n=1 Tax=Winogradskyella epiphytica TaxID=262005 RepID=A0A2V4XH80_9FLAO|nr:rod shape-determining protein MreD [Winogradskyella epiphytica]PYE82610.1 rod shape-determining protein MreD [Winogradskyella epiphytica]GGW72227.1 rod shape-determining protein MreD [Winogradskyella epiphytica]